MKATKIREGQWVAEGGGPLRHIIVEGDTRRSAISGFVKALDRQSEELGLNRLQKDVERCHAILDGRDVPRHTEGELAALSLSGRLAWYVAREEV